MSYDILYLAPANETAIIDLLIYLGFYVAFNTVQVISRQVVLKGRGNQYVQLVKVLYCKLPTNGKQLPAFPHEVEPGTETRSQRWEARVLPLCHHDWLRPPANVFDLRQFQISVLTPTCFVGI